MAHPQEGTTLLGSPPQLDLAAPRAGLAEGSKGVAASRGGGEAGLERAFSAGEKGSLIWCQEAGEAQSRLCSEGSRRRLRGLEPRTSLPELAALLPQTQHPWRGSTGSQGGPQGLNSHRASPAGPLSPRPRQAAPRNQAVGSKPGGNRQSRDPPAPLTLLPAPRRVGKSSPPTNNCPKGRDLPVTGLPEATALQAVCSCTRMRAQIHYKEAVALPRIPSCRSPDATTMGSRKHTCPLSTLPQQIDGSIVLEVPSSAPCAQDIATTARNLPRVRRHPKAQGTAGHPFTALL